MYTHRNTHQYLLGTIVEFKIANNSRQFRKTEMLYEKLMSAWKACDISSWRSCYHQDYTFVSHANGTTMAAGDMSDEMMLGMMQTTTLEKQRCIYEDENILVEHSFATFGSGAKEAVLAVHTKKDGLIWQTETGATPI